MPQLETSVSLTRTRGFPEEDEGVDDYPDLIDKFDMATDAVVQAVTVKDAIEEAVSGLFSPPA